MALLDTGGHYCILSKDVAASIQGHFGECLDEVDLRTAYGLIRGKLYRHRITLIAEAGDSLDIDATVFVSPEWRWSSFLGYTGILDRIRFAADSPANEFFFGPPG